MLAGVLGEDGLHLLLIDHALSIGSQGVLWGFGGHLSNRTPDQRWRWC
jgi:hypothetical protein